MELTLAEEIRALLKMHEEESPQPRGKCFMQFWCAFPALAAKMLAVIEERDNLREFSLRDQQLQDAAIARQNERILQRDVRIAELENGRVQPSEFFHSAARIAELKEDSVRWETRYRVAMNEWAKSTSARTALWGLAPMAERNAAPLTAEQERDLLRFEAECLQVTVAK